MSFRLSPPVYEELKMTVLDLSLYNNRNAVLKAIQGPPILLTNLQTSPSHEVAQSQKACRDCKRSGLRTSWGDLHPFPAPSEMQVIYLVFSRKEDDSQQKGKTTTTTNSKKK